MTLNIKDIIMKKAKNKELTEAEVDYVIQSYAQSEISDAQMSALITGIYINDLTDAEISYFLKAVLADEKIVDLKEIDPEFKKYFILDKHSTGGVGDKVSLILTPILNSFPKIAICKMSGRSLGHTGGTIDKLESFKNLKTNYSIEDAINIMKKNPAIIIEASKNILKTEKKIYGLRDETGIVNKPALIIPSIMSKKFYFKSDLIVLDVKCGKGALLNKLSPDQMKTQLANKMVKLGKIFKRNVVAVITNMNIPLGNYVGNKLEVYEVITFLQNKHVNPQLKELIYSFATIALIESKLAKDSATAHAMVDKVINDGTALNKFKELITSQNGIWVDDVETFKAAKHCLEIKANSNGHIKFEDVIEVAKISEKLGAARLLAEGEIDYNAGIEIVKHEAENVIVGDVIAKLYSNNPISKELIEQYYRAINIVDSTIKTAMQPKMVYHIVKENDIK